MGHKTGTLIDDLPPNGKAAVLFTDGTSGVVCHNIPDVLPMTIDAGLNVVAWHEDGVWDLIQAECPD